MRQQQIAMLARELLHTLVGDRVGVQDLDFLFLPLARVAHQLIGSLPRLAFLLATDHLQPHAEADAVVAPMRASQRLDLGVMFGSAVPWTTPELMQVATFSRHFQRLPRAGD